MGIVVDLKKQARLVVVHMLFVLLWGLLGYFRWPLVHGTDERFPSSRLGDVGWEVLGHHVVNALRKFLTRASTNGQFPGRNGCTYVKQKVVAIPIPSAEKLDLPASSLRPRVTISKRGVKAEGDDTESQEDNSTGSADPLAGLETKARNAGSDVVVSLTESQDGEEECREVVVQEQLALHQEEWEVVECPSKNKSTDLVVETLEWHVVEVLVSTLPSQESNTLEDGEDGDSNGGRPPDDRVADEVDLAVLLTPEVDTTAENWPGLWARIPGVGV